MLSQEKIEQKAKEMYYKQMDLCPVQHHFMWGQCSEDYRKVWRDLAEITLDDDELTAPQIVHALVRVSFDYYRCEQFIGMFASEEEAVQAAKNSDCGDNIIVSDKPTGSMESDGVSRHAWIIPSQFKA